MGLSEAWGVFGQALVLAIGLQLIGWSKWRARLAEEAWRKRGGPIDEKLGAELRGAVDSTRANLESARTGLEAAAKQLRSEAN